MSRGWGTRHRSKEKDNKRTTPLLGKPEGVFSQLEQRRRPYLKNMQRKHEVAGPKSSQTRGGGA